MPEYPLLICDNEASLESADPDASGEILTGHQTFMDKHRAAIRDGKALQPTSTATSIRRERSADFVVTGTFAETKEVPRRCPARVQYPRNKHRWVGVS
jgi:hypothetical protein